MNKLAFTIVIFTLFNMSVAGQITLKIVIKNLQNNTGHVVMDFRNGDDVEVKAFSEKIIDNQCLINIIDLKPGKYSFKYFHDENNNIKLDTNFIGIPKEGYGFSNDAKGKFGPPDFKDTVFEVKNDTTVSCIVYYIY